MKVMLKEKDAIINKLTKKENKIKNITKNISFVSNKEKVNSEDILERYMTNQKRKNKMNIKKH